ncbi:MAG TPA: type II toxin-antitoxin system HicA family toxin [Candidatus Scatosoma pullicola]|nr:type II toxin-antitoxin system HicA family toxin [Candidatus Scatosoma pullicola]
MPMTPKEMVRLLKANGFEEVRQPGTSHLRMVNKETGRQTTVPMHSKDLGKGLEQAILKQAGLKK